MTGDLTVRGVTKPVVLDVGVPRRRHDPLGDQRQRLLGVHRGGPRGWGLTRNQALEPGGVLVGKKARIELFVEAIPKP